MGPLAALTSLLLLVDPEPPLGDAITANDHVIGLKVAAKKVARTKGCTKVTQCKVMPVGTRSCGGPSDHIVYCSKTTDEKALTAKVKLATDAEAAMNEKFGLTSICSVVTPPTVKLEKKECVADPGQPGDVPM